MPKKIDWTNEKIVQAAREAMIAYYRDENFTWFDVEKYFYKKTGIRAVFATIKKHGKIEEV